MELGFLSSARTQVYPQRGFRPLESGPIRDRRALSSDTFLEAGGAAAFGASQVAAAVNAAMYSNYLSGTTKASRLLSSLLSIPFSADGSPPAKLEVPSHLSLPGPAVVSAVTSSLRPELRRVARFSSLYASTTLSPENCTAADWQVPARAALGVLFGSSSGSGGGGSAEADLICDFDCAGGGAALPGNGDDNDDNKAARLLGLTLNREAACL